MVNQQGPHQATVPRPSPVAVPPPQERRARLVLRRLEPWSVLKFSLLFYFCLLLVGLLVLSVIWFVLGSMGVFDQVAEFAASFDQEVTFSAATVFRYYALIGAVGVVLWSLGTVLLTLLFNLVNDITGGIEVVLGERYRTGPGFR